MGLGRWTLAVASSWLFAAAAAAGTYEAVPFDYRRAAKGLEAGDTLILKPDDYKHGLVLEGLVRLALWPFTRLVSGAR